MNWVVFGLLAWVFLGLEKGLRDALTLGTTGVAPSFVFILLALVAMLAPRGAVFWAAIALGLGMDLIFEIPRQNSGAGVYIPGPHALAYAVACQLILALRPLMIRRNPLTMGFLALAGSLVAGITLVALLTIRAKLGAPIVWDGKHQLLAALGSAVYTGVLGTGLALLLFPMTGLLGLPSMTQRRFGFRT
jgi:hypothetical protein